MNEGRLEEEGKKRRKKYVDLITYMYTNNDREFNLSFFFQLTDRKQIMA
jgi:hypothetical protein